jgi:choline kinase
MKALILAAGRGTRMLRLTADRPKCLLEVRGKSLLDWQLEAINGAGIDEIAIITGYKHDLISRPGVSKFHNAKWQDTNMVSTLECARDWLQTEPCIVSYSDIFYDAVAIKTLASSNHPIAITFHIDWLNIWTKRFGNPLLDAESFRVTESGFVVEIGQKPKSVDEVQGQYMGLLKISPDGWKAMQNTLLAMPEEISTRISMTELLQKVIESTKIKIEALPFEGVWGEIDSEKDLKLYNS